MAKPQASGLAGRSAQRARTRTRARRTRSLAMLVVAASVALVTLLLTAFGTGSAPAAETGPAPAQRLLPTGPPRPQVVAMYDSLGILVPIEQSRITAIGYHAVGPGALPLEPVGRHANPSVLERVVQRLVGNDADRPAFYLIEGGQGHQTGGLDVGAPVDTDVYAPVDGTVLAITEVVIDGETYGVRIDLQPARNPGLVVSVSNLRPDPALTVGSTVAAARSKIGRIIDVTEVEEAGLARYTQDRGLHVHVELHAAVSGQVAGSR